MLERRQESIAQWFARGSAALVAAFVLLFAIGEGGFSLFQATWTDVFLMTAFWVAIAGLAISWWSDWLGGSLAVGGMLAFYLGHRWLAGTWPGGWVFPLIAFTGALVLLVACFGPMRTNSANVLKGSPS
jgi:hypothetical protein